MIAFALLTKNGNGVATISPRGQGMTDRFKQSLGNDHPFVLRALLKGDCFKQSTPTRRSERIEKEAARPRSLTAVGTAITPRHLFAVMPPTRRSDSYLLTPMKPWRSKCRMISCAASSGLSSAVLMTTSASRGGSYGSEIPVKSLRMPARALA
jgi:hypothetical protein